MLYQPNLLGDNLGDKYLGLAEASPYLGFLICEMGF